MMPRGCRGLTRARDVAFVAEAVKGQGLGANQTHRLRAVVDDVFEG